MTTSCLERLTWVYCPGHAGVRGTERADRLATAAPLVGTMQMHKDDILISASDFLSWYRFVGLCALKRPCAFLGFGGPK